MSSTSNNLGAVVDNGVVVFRGFAVKGFRDSKKNVAKYYAFLLRPEDVKNGLSVGLSPEGSIKHLSTNEGYCQIEVEVIHKLPFGLQVRADQTDSAHAFICNLPLQTNSDDDREKARFIAGELARKAKVITCDPFVPSSNT